MRAPARFWRSSDGQTRDHERRIEGGPGIREDPVVGEHQRHAIPRPEQIPRRLDRPGREAPAQPPEVVHVRARRRSHEAERDGRGRDAGHGPDRHGDAQGPRGRRVALEEPGDEQRAPEAGERQHRRLREPDQSGARQPGGHTPRSCGIGLAQPQRHERHRDDRRHVDAVRLDLGAVADERSADREHRDREGHGVAVEQPPREKEEHHERREADGKQQEAEREVALPEHAADPLLGQHEAHGRDLVVAERFGGQRRRGAVDQIADDRELVEPERRVRGVLEDAQRRPDRHERPERRRTAQEGRAGREPAAPQRRSTSGDQRLDPLAAIERERHRGAGGRLSPEGTSRRSPPRGASGR